jgi:hypothetical protein
MANIVTRSEEVARAKFLRHVQRQIETPQVSAREQERAGSVGRLTELGQAAMNLALIPFLSLRTRCINGMGGPCSVTPVIVLSTVRSAGPRWAIKDGRLVELRRDWASPIQFFDHTGCRMASPQGNTRTS